MTQRNNRHGASLAAAAALAVAVVAPSRAEAQVLSRFALRGELGVGGMLSTYQRNDDTSMFAGNAKDFGLGFHGSVRLAFNIVDALSIQASFANWWFTSDRQATGRVVAPMGGLRFEPRVGSLGRFFVDANVGPGFTGDLTRLAFDVGVGFEFGLGRAFAIGPVVRYGQTMQGAQRDNGSVEPYDDDAQYLAAGVAVTLRIPAAESPSDRDGDGVADDGDVCPDVPQDATPDPTRAGCPAEDRDHDGVLDGDDRCVDVPQGNDPDPNRRGCPNQDPDHDGVLGADDQCPETAQGDTPDPDRRGCPDGDRDSDGVRDHVDQCPDAPRGNTPDPAREGCPIMDRDHDGIADDRDRCPDEAETYNGQQDDDGCPERAAALATFEGGTIQILQQVNFRTDSDQIVGARSFQVLEAVVSILRTRSSVRIDVQGHTDNRGNPEHNRDLSDRRAASVVRYLTEHGIDASRLEAHGYGPDRPLESNTSAASRARNRRVEFHVMQ